MARYAHLSTVTSSAERLRQIMVEILESSCNLNLIYDTGDYIMAREKPGQVSFPKLAIVEVFIDQCPNTVEELRMDLVVKNEELPLHEDNHCHQMFNQVWQAITENQQWQLLAKAAR